jgi:hypothetical protein
MKDRIWDGMWTAQRPGSVWLLYGLCYGIRCGRRYGLWQQ